MTIDLDMVMRTIVRNSAVWRGRIAGSACVHFNGSDFHDLPVLAARPTREIVFTRPNNTTLDSKLMESSIILLFGLYHLSCRL